MYTLLIILLNISYILYLKYHIIMYFNHSIFCLFCKQKIDIKQLSIVYVTGLKQTLQMWFEKIFHGSAWFEFPFLSGLFYI